MRPIRPLLIAVLTAMLMSTAPLPAMAAEECPPASASADYEAVERCRADYIEIRTADRRWTRLKTGAAMCFQPKEQVWEWKCRGYTEAARCRGVRTKTPAKVRAELRNGEVIWKCFKN